MYPPARRCWPKSPKPLDWQVCSAIELQEIVRATHMSRHFCMSCRLVSYERILKIRRA